MSLFVGTFITGAEQRIRIKLRSTRLNYRVNSMIIVLFMASYHIFNLSDVYILSEHYQLVKLKT